VETNLKIDITVADICDGGHELRMQCKKVLN